MKTRAIAMGGAVVAIGVLAGVAGAQPSDRGKPLLPKDVEVVRAPGVEERLRYFPERASKARVEGRATVTCRVEAKGDLSDCQVLAEDPTGWDFGEATKQIAESVRLASKAHDGSPTAGRFFQFSFIFGLRDRSGPKAALPLDRGVVDEDGLLQRWVRLPRGEAIEQCFRRAISRAETVELLLECRSSLDDRLTDCAVVRNSRAPDKRYENAAMCSADAARIRVTRPDGQPVAGAKVRFPLNFLPR